MNIYPAIDIKGGNCVRLRQGDLNQVTLFNINPLNQAKQFSEAGFEWLHVVDLDGAARGRPMNKEEIFDIAKNTDLKIQVGGGIRNIKTIEEYLNNGIARIILGTSAIRDMDLVRQACELFPGRIIVGVDVRSNKVAVEGWLEDSDILVFDLISELKDVGVASVIYTDITRDGILSGFDEVGAIEIAKNCEIPLIVSGGVSSVNDLDKISKLSKFGIEGAIIGRALYEGNISFEEALNYRDENYMTSASCL
ncbi:MAG: 1-(5-phosphoribosyl)-5-[(5-phosphoribosylamino)methylideneamino]imidazole-4-carboxamide isomerase [Rickettsiales bacterium]|jgi:phosphoribosylformimino-5-aminoimidazole carboxamide ribotide isomerase|nr:1-(5-phosphoribosyl)-5-[(5-phosphoribosylamino)methylideneamino]imidazole-4-carboxamide isomerase [Rickettsiales bacterium]